MGTTWKLYDPRILSWVPCPPVQLPPPFIHFIPMPWAVLACVAILHTGGYYWNHLEPCGTPRILLDVPYPQYLKFMAALVCRSPPFHTFYSHALGSVGMRCHSPYNWMLLEHIGTTTNHLKPSGNYTTLEPPGIYTTLRFSWMCPTPSTWNVWLHWCAGPPPFIHFIYSHAMGCVGMRCHSPYWWILLEPPGTMWNS